MAGIIRAVPGDAGTELHSSEAQKLPLSQFLQELCGVAMARPPFYWADGETEAQRQCRVQRRSHSGRENMFWALGSVCFLPL